LAEAGVSYANLSNKEITERSAALAWARHHLKEGIVPDEMAGGLPDDMRQTLLSLYALPPYRGDTPTPSDAHRLAFMIRLYDPETMSSTAEKRIHRHHHAMIASIPTAPTIMIPAARIRR
jgi:hypothetical protein